MLLQEKKEKNVSKRSITKLLKKHTPPSLPFVSKSPFRSNVISERSGRCYCKKKKKKNVSKRSITKLIKKKHYQAYLSFPRVHFEAMSTLKGLGSVTARKKNVSKRSKTKLIKKTHYLSFPRVKKLTLRKNSKNLIRQLENRLSTTFYLIRM